MTKQFSPTKIRAAAKDLLKAADKLDDDLDGFLEEAKGIGEPCGDAEPIGMLLGVSYAAAEEVLIEGLESVVAGFESFSGKLELMATNDELAQQENVDTVNNVGA